MFLVHRLSWCFVQSHSPPTRLASSTMAEVSPEASPFASRSFITADTVPHAVLLVSFF